MDEMANEAHLSEEKAKKAMIDAARLADELRSEQDMAQQFEKERKVKLPVFYNTIVPNNFFF